MDKRPQHILFGFVFVTLIILIAIMWWYTTGAHIFEIVNAPREETETEKKLKQDFDEISNTFENARSSYATRTQYIKQQQAIVTSTSLFVSSTPQTISSSTIQLIIKKLSLSPTST